MTSVAKPLCRVYFGSAVCVLGATGLGKLAACFWDHRMWHVNNSVFGVPEVLVWVGAALMELSIVGVLLGASDNKLKSGLIVWLCLLFAWYRIVGALIATTMTPCPCLGAAGTVLRLSATQSDAMALGIIGYLLLGSIGVYLACTRIPKGSPKSVCR